MDITKNVTSRQSAVKNTPYGPPGTAALVLVVMLAVAHFVFFVVAPNDGLIRSVGDSVLLSAHGLLAALLMFYASTHARVERRFALVLRLFAFGQLAHALGDVLWTVQEFASGAEPDTPSIADLGYASYYIFALAGLYHLPLRTLKATAGLKFAIDIGIVVVSSSMMLAYLVLPSLVNDPQELGLGLLLASLYPFLNLVLLWLATSALFRLHVPSSTMSFYAASVFALILADAGFAYQDANSTYVSGASIVDLLFAANAVLVSCAAIASMREPTHHVELADTGESSPLPLETKPWVHMLSLMTPFVWLAMAFAVVIYDRFVYSDPGPGAILIMLGFFCTVGLVVLRQSVTLRENVALTQQQRRLLNASLILARPLDLLDACDRVLDEVNSLSPSDESYIALFHGDGEQITIAGARRWLNLPQRAGVIAFRDGYKPATKLLTVEHLSDVHPVTMPRDMINALLALLGDCRRELWPHKTDAMASLISVVPLISNHKTIGLVFIGTNRAEQHLFDQSEVLSAFGLQAAASIENARLRLAQVLAATTAERTRLSRELHDSVLQSLFGMALGMRTAREHLGNNTAAADSAIEYSLRLAESAHSEMRSLVLELRPESLINEGLISALRKQTQTLAERHKLKLTVNAAIDEPVCPIHEKEAIYRIMMEAFNNVIKHASAKQVTLSVLSNGRELILTLMDDGIGFDAGSDYPGHIGLASMQERSASIGAALDVISAVNAGSTVKLTVSLKR